MKDCAFANENECMALVKKQCKGCSFCKTTEELIAGRKKADDRIHSLPKIKQAYIKYKYYSRGNSKSG